MPQNDPSTIQILVHGLVAICGGLARALSDGKRTFKALIIEAFIAGFSGGMIGLLAITMFDSVNISIVVAGTGGYMGAESMKMLAVWVHKKFK